MVPAEEAELGYTSGASRQISGPNSWGGCAPSGPDLCPSPAPRRGRRRGFPVPFSAKGRGSMSAKWTFMVYMAGNNSLSDAADVDLQEMRQVGSSDAVKVMAFVAQQRVSGTAQRFQVGKGGAGEKAEQLNKVDSGDPQTVMDFVRWAVAQAPADRYALVLWNHGGGWEPDDLDQIYSEVRGARAVRGGGVTEHEMN